VKGEIKIMEIAQKIYEETLVSGGVTVDLLGNVPTTGFMVSELGGVEVSLDKFSVQDIEHVIEENRNALFGAGAYIGTWVNGGMVYIDYSVNFECLGKAIAFGRRQGQRTIFSLNTKQVIWL
jgi:hypothetical protein